MSQANLDIKVQGVRGGMPLYQENKGYVSAIIDNGIDLISVDAFQGVGDDFKRREKCLIRIKINEVNWEGTAEQLAQVFRDATDMADDIDADIQAGYLVSEDGDDGIAFSNYKEFSDKYKTK